MRRRRWIILVALIALALFLILLFVRKESKKREDIPQSSTEDTIRQPDNEETELPQDNTPTDDSAEKPSETPAVNGGDFNTPDVGSKPKLPGDNNESSETPSGGSEGASRAPIVLPEIELD